MPHRLAFRSCRLSLGTAEALGVIIQAYAESSGPYTVIRVAFDAVCGTGIECVVVKGTAPQNAQDAVSRFQVLAAVAGVLGIAESRLFHVRSPQADRPLIHVAGHVK
jgi:hypothetical protein